MHIQNIADDLLESIASLTFCPYLQHNFANDLREDEGTTDAPKGAIEYTVEKMSQVPTEIIAQLAVLVHKAGQTVLSKAGIEQNIRKGKLMAYAFKDGKFVAGLVLKQNAHTNDAIGEASGIDIDGMPEMGFMAVDPEMQGQGVSTRLNREMQKHISSAFSTTRANNSAIIKVMQKVGFEKRATFDSPYSSNKLILWVWEK